MRKVCIYGRVTFQDEKKVSVQQGGMQENVRGGKTSEPVWAWSSLFPPTSRHTYITKAIICPCSPK